MRVLLTGAGGLIGRKVAELLRPHAELLAIVRDAAMLPPDVEVIAADLADPGFLKRLPPRMDAVIHLAQSPSFADFPAAALPVFQVNVAALVSMLDWAVKAGVRKFVHASTGGVYGRGPNPFREEDPVRLEGPLAFYVGTKSAAEQLAGAYGGNFDVTALRFFFVYGPGQKASMLMPRLVRAVAAGEPVSLAGEDGMRLNPVYVDDAASSVVAALSLKGSAVVNVAGGEVLSMREIANLIGEAVNKVPLFRQTGEAGGGDVIGDIARMRTLLHAPGVDFRNGIKSIATAVRN